LQNQSEAPPLTDAAKKKENVIMTKSNPNNNCTNPNFTQIITIDLETYTLAGKNQKTPRINHSIQLN
jgi:hypothetical protein